MATGKRNLRYHSVNVVSGSYMCAAAAALKDKKILSAEAPMLPLKECDNPGDCRCVYKHFDDRRQGTRREDQNAAIRIVTIAPVAKKDAERRRKGARREADID